MLLGLACLLDLVLQATRRSVKTRPRPVRSALVMAPPAPKMSQVKLVKTSYTYGALLSAILNVMYLVLAFLFTRAAAIAFMESDCLQLTLCTLTITYALKYRSRLSHLPFVAFLDGFGAEITGVYKASNGIRANGLDADSGWLVPYLLGKVGLSYWWCLSGLLNKRPVYAILDTGSQCNIMSADYAYSHHLHVIGLHESFRLANSALVTSEGYVEIEWAFEGEHSVVYRLKFHVIEGLPTDLIIGSETLRETETLSRNFDRVRRMMCWKSSFTVPIALLERPRSECQLLHGFLAKHVAVQAVPDTGAGKNIMDADWARSNGFNIQSGKGERTFLLFADKSVQRTLGTVKTQWTFKDDSERPITFHVLHNCAANVILGEKFLYEHKVFQEHSESIVHIASAHGLSGLFHFGLIPKAKKIGFLGKKERREVPVSPFSSRRDVAIADRAEMHRQDVWDATFDCGRSADRIENEAEDKRRKEHEVWRVSKLQCIQMAERLRATDLSTRDPGPTTRH